MSLNLKPLGDRIIVEPLESEQTTLSGLILPETAKEKPQKGTVLAVGPGARNKGGQYVALDVKVSDVVWFTKYGGTEIKLDSRKLLILKENDILAIIEGDVPKKKK
jgi:chaperonin GroES